MVRELKDIKLKEVSLVDKAANKKKFLFFKQQEGKPAALKKLKKKLNIVIDSDGTVGGTKITLNKDDLGALRDFNFSFWGNDDDSRAVSCSYSKIVETEDGFSRSETFYLSKGDNKMDAKIQEQLQEYFGKDEEIDFEKAEDNDVITKALETVNEYRGDFPDDLKKAVGAIAKQAGFCDTIVSKILEKEQTNVVKAGAKLSKETMKKITEALAALKSVLPQLAEKTEKSDKEEKTEVGKAIEELKKSIESIEKKKDDASKDELTETLEELKKRLETVEKGTGVRKSIESQDNDDNNNEDRKWPSFSSKS